ncbi:hypothetical protein ECC02_010628 [Trypanosoma cruzi]|uniref:Uncharacterized protein n=1 Tax=Trypanosoma cruzi TaxID=5693 RepID=A0A7J6XRF6_TRYCR|nr:hypothetical protein ECC02_010628 [Trypanosoma cruzi]
MSLCVCFVCGSRFAMRAVFELCLPREVASLPRTQQRCCDDVCVSFCFTSFYFPFALLFSALCADRLTDFSNSTTTTTTTTTAARTCARKNDDDCMARVETELCGSKDPSVHWRPVGESSWTACRTDKKPNSRDLTEEEAFNAIVGDFAARSCSDYDGTNNSVGMEEYMNSDLTTPNTADVCSNGTVSMVLGHPPRRQGADKQQCVQQRHTEHISFKQEDLSEQRNLVRR